MTRAVGAKREIGYGLHGATVDVDLGLHPDIGMVVAIVADNLRLVRVEDGFDLDISDLDARHVVTAAVGPLALGSITGVAIGCRDGRIVVGRILASGDAVHLLADFVIDEAIARIWIPTGANEIVVRTISNTYFAFAIHPGESISGAG